MCFICRILKLETQLKKQQQQFSKSADAFMGNKENKQKDPPPNIKIDETIVTVPPPSTVDPMIPEGLDAVELGQQVSELDMEVATLRASLAGHERVMREQARENQRLQIVEREAKRDAFKSEETK